MVHQSINIFTDHQLEMMSKHSYRRSILCLLEAKVTSKKNYRAKDDFPLEHQQLASPKMEQILMDRRWIATSLVREYNKRCHLPPPCKLSYLSK